MTLYGYAFIGVWHPAVGERQADACCQCVCISSCCYYVAGIPGCPSNLRTAPCTWPSSRRAPRARGAWTSTSPRRSLPARQRAGMTPPASTRPPPCATCPAAVWVRGQACSFPTIGLLAAGNNYSINQSTPSPTTHRGPLPIRRSSSRTLADSPADPCRCRCSRELAGPRPVAAAAPGGAQGETFSTILIMMCIPAITA